MFFVAAEFRNIANYKETFAIVISTILGLALSSFVQGVATRSD
jgi:hypothetical protein